MAEPWMKFYTSDWRSDPRLKMCSAGARGVWIEMICLMHEATPYGHLLVHGQTPNEAQLASLTGIPLAELGQFLSELEQMGVFSRTKEGVIYSRKLVRMAARSAKARKNGKSGGNPKLLTDKDNPDLLNLPDKPPDKPQKPEARSQKEIRESKDSLCASGADLAFQDFWEAYPHRDGKRGKAPAKKAWAKAAKRAPPDLIISQAKAYSSYLSEARAKKKFVPHPPDPSTWLNQERWTDELSPLRRTATPEEQRRAAEWDQWYEANA